MNIKMSIKCSSFVKNFCSTYNKIIYHILPIGTILPFICRKIIWIISVRWIDKIYKYIRSTNPNLFWMQNFQCFRFSPSSLNIVFWSIFLFVDVQKNRNPYCGNENDIVRCIFQQICGCKSDIFCDV